MEADFQSKLSKIEESNNDRFKAFEKRIEENVDKLLEQRLTAVSHVVANLVTQRIKKSIGRLVKNKGIGTDQSGEDSMFVTQESPQGNKADQTQVALSENKSIGDQWRRDSTQNMLQELNKIEHNTFHFTDPPHDNNTGSETIIE